EGVPFPNWRAEFGWRQDGTRVDELDGRSAKTVYYEHAGRRVAYTIVSGDGIHAPSGSQPTARNGVHPHCAPAGGAPGGSWGPKGRNGVLSSGDVGDHEVLTLATWKGDGAVSF